MGKLALFGIGKRITIETTTENDTEIVRFILDWDEIIKTSGEYFPQSDRLPKGAFTKGTRITLSKLTRSSDFDLYSIGISLSKMFNCFDKDFCVTLHKNDNSEYTVKVTRDLRYEKIGEQFSWNVQDLAQNISDIYEHKESLKGRVISSLKPMRQDLRGISLYANGRLVNIAGFFGVSEAGHTFTYLSGWIDADFIDETDDDLISTDRQSLNWDHPEAEQLRAFLQKITRFLVRDWSAKRKEARSQNTCQREGIDITEWLPKVPDSLRSILENVVNSVGDNPTVDDAEYSTVVKNLYELIPPYTYYHYRHLHKSVQEASKEKYEKKDYYGALLEACKRYVDAVKIKVEEKAPSAAQLIHKEGDRGVMGKAFGNDSKRLLRVMLNETRKNGRPFTDDTKSSLEDAQMFLSQGIVTGYRNPITHEEHKDLAETGVITEQHCLDALSLLSLLFERLDKAEKNPEL